MFMLIQYRFRMIVLCAAIVVAIVSSHTSAVETSIWEVVTAPDFEEGKPTDVSIRSDGQVILSSSLELLYDTEELYVWCLVQDLKGTIYAGTGNNGRVFKVTEDGEGSLFFDSPELEILSLAIDSRGHVYAGTAPDGIIYKMSPTGEASTFCETGERYVWSLIFDTQDNLYAGTGDHGKIIRITPEGESELVYDSNETHVMTVVLDSNNNLYAGSESSGIVYKISPDKDVFVLYDAPQKEIHSLTLAQDGTLYAGATEAVIYVKKATVQRDPSSQNNGRDQEERPRTPEVTKVAKEKSVVYELSTDGVVTKLWSSSALLLSLCLQDNGSLTIGTGEDGKLYSVQTDRTSLSLAKSSESQILSLLKNGQGRILLGTGNMGKIFQFTSEYIEEGTFESDVYDTQTISKWGKISYQADLPSGTSISIATRSGNSMNPDDTWSNWSEEYSKAQGESIASPPARFVQWRATLKTSNSSTSPILKKVSVAYLQRNLSPQITDVNVHSPGQKSGKSAQRTSSKTSDPSDNSLSNNGRRSVDWKASDPNNDHLVYTVYFRGTDEQTWKILKEDEKSTSYSLNTESLPDGSYVIKVVASDSPGNPPSTALSTEKTSEPFLVDNTPPRVFDVKATQGSNEVHFITGKAKDAASTISRAEYSIDAGDWTMMFPEDEIFDSKEEDFTFSLEALSPGEHTLVIRVVDESGNIGAGKVVFTVK